jgi:2-phospho-L-lactate/phosphoenolpyruvate guanylyltransferase
MAAETVRERRPDGRALVAGVNLRHSRGEPDAQDRRRAMLARLPGDPRPDATDRGRRTQGGASYHRPVTSQPDTTRGRTIIAIVPVGHLDGAKSRLGAVLDAEERYALVRRLATATIAAVTGSTNLSETLVITPDDAARALALDAGARPILQRSVGLNAGLREARDEATAAGADAILIVPIDLPRITTDAIDEIVLRMLAAAPPIVGIVPDRHGRGTNALYLSPPDVIDLQFGGDSRAAHVAGGHEQGATVIELTGPLADDLDTPDDLILAELVDPELARG